MAKPIKNQLSDYVPRHIRMGICCELPKVNLYQEVHNKCPYEYAWAHNHLIDF